MKKTIILQQNDYSNDKFLGTLEKKIYFKNLSEKMFAKIAKYGWIFSSTFINNNDNLVIECVRDYKPTHSLSNQQLIQLVREIKNFLLMQDGDFSILKHTNTNIYIQ